MTVAIHLKNVAQPKEYKSVRNTYTKDGLFCIITSSNLVHKYPVQDIFRVEESYE